MKETGKSPLSYIVQSTEKLKQLILENPDLPLVVMANEDANIGEYSYMFCTTVYAEIGEILDCNQEVNDDICFTDREQFRDEVEDMVYNKSDYDDRPDEWYEAEIERVIAEYDPYWKKCILLTVGN